MHICLDHRRHIKNESRCRWHYTVNDICDLFLNVLFIIVIYFHFLSFHENLPECDDCELGASCSDGVVVPEMSRGID